MRFFAVAVCALSMSAAVACSSENDDLGDGTPPPSSSSSSGAVDDDDTSSSSSSSSSSSGEFPVGSSSSSSGSAEPSSSSSSGSSSGQTASLRRQVQDIIDFRCTNCHGGGAQGGLNLIDVGNAINKASTRVNSRTLIVPGDASQSLFVDVLRSAVGGVRIMPPSGVPLTAQQIALIETWINEGAE